LGKILEPVMVAKGFTLSGKGAGIGKLQAVEMDARNGWLLIGWQRTAPGVPTVKPATADGRAAPSMGTSSMGMVTPRIIIQEEEEEKMAGVVTP
jgi:hypothetical protein